MAFGCVAYTLILLYAFLVDFEVFNKFKPREDLAELWEISTGMSKWKENR
jgi:hypothetical protein